ncbi:MAG TPA: NlpC/P60 family protein, partial [Acidobacteriota bacterium]|nr:NlpC/P60 family protein [Acidobacteriota bacterium]
SVAAIALSGLVACRAAARTVPTPPSPAPKAPAAPAAAAPLATASANVTRLGYTIQVGAFAIEKNAQKLVRSLAASGVEAFYFPAGSGLYKVRFGDFPSREAAVREAGRLVADARIGDFFVVAPGDYAAFRPGQTGSALRGALAKTAASFLGVDYSWGGETSLQGFDCSGLVRAVYQLNGLNLPRSVAGQFQAGEAVAPDHLLEGDLVFFSASPGGPLTHVGIYVGQGVFIHAPGEGKKVRRESLERGWFKASFRGARGYVAGPRSASWVVQASGTTASLRGVSAVDDRTAWASGANGTVLRTLDGGTTWTLIPVPGEGSADFRDIEAFGADEAVIMAIGRPAKIFKTRDGGKTWRRTFFDDSPGIFLDGLAFFDDKNGIAVGDPMDGRFFLIATSDGGETWAALPPGSRPEAREAEAAFAASGTSLAVLGAERIWLATGGAVSRVWRSEDGGTHWQASPSALLEGPASAGGFSVVFLNGETGIAVGGDYRAEIASAGNAALSSDGGRTWVPVGDRRPGGFREAVAFVPGTHPPVAITVGPSGSDLSSDLGRTWTPIVSPAGFHALSFAKKGRAGWAVGKNGLIARSTL